MTAVHVVVPEGIDDPARPSGGNVYDRRVCHGLGSIGWSVHEHAVPAAGRNPTRVSLAALADVVAADPRRRSGAGRRTGRLDGSGGARAAREPAAAGRARAHAAGPLARPADARQRERAVLAAAAAVVTTSAWTRRRLLELYALPADRVHVAEPARRRRRPRARDRGRRGAALRRGGDPGKGHDVLLDALATVADLSWQCVCVGSLERERGYAERLRRRARDDGLDDRVSFPGPRTGADLDRSYAAADLLVLASRAETYGMVVTEALARGLPVVAAEVGGVPEALGHGADGTGRGCSCRPATRRPSAPHCAPGSATQISGAAAPGRARAARVARRVAGHRVRPRRRPGWGGAMIAEAIRVSRGWLALREPADAAARARDLVEHLPAQPTGHVIHDLGCGTGAMGRWLAPLLPGPQHWVVHDRDADLLEVAAAEPPGPAADGAAVAVEPRHSDLTRLRPGDLAGATLITASALLDLLTGDELAGLITVCAGAGCPVLLTLSVVGRVDLAPADPLDSRVAAAFDAHQRRTTERGRLLGPDAVAFAVGGFGRLGAEVLVRPSPWRLGASDAGLAAEWFTGWLGAACEQQPDLAAATGAYARRRLAGTASGQLAVTVDHADLLILPRAQRAPG